MHGKDRLPFGTPPGKALPGGHGDRNQAADGALPGARRDLLSLLLSGLGLHVQARRSRALRRRRPPRPGTGVALQPARRGPSGADRRARGGGSGGLARDAGQDDRRRGSRRDLRHRDRRTAGGPAARTGNAKTRQRRGNAGRRMEDNPLPTSQSDCTAISSRTWTCIDSSTSNPSRIRSSTSGFSSGNR